MTMTRDSGRGRSRKFKKWGCSGNPALNNTGECFFYPAFYEEHIFRPRCHLVLFLHMAEVYKGQCYSYEVAHGKYVFGN